MLPYEKHGGEENGGRENNVCSIMGTENLGSMQNPMHTSEMHTFPLGGQSGSYQLVQEENVKYCICRLCLALCTLSGGCLFKDISSEVEGISRLQNLAL